MKFSQFNKEIIKENIRYSVEKITEIIREIGQRESGSIQAFEAMELLKKDLENCADEIHYEEYKMAPKAFTHFTKTVSASIIASIAVGCFCKYTDTSKLGKIGKIMKNPIVPHAVVAGTALTGLAITAVEFLCYKEFCDMFYKKITARNLAAMYPGPADYYHNRKDSYDRLVPEAIKA